MGRRILAVVATITGTLVLGFNTPVNAESGGGTGSGTRTAMGQIAAGDRTNCAVVSERLACWGDNGHYKAAVGATPSQLPIATYSPGLTGVQSVAASEKNTCVIVTGGGVKCVGDNTYGQLGIGQTSSGSFSSPESVCAVGGCGNGLLSGVTQISMGFGFACALLSDSGVACWGSNDRYQTGGGAVTMTQVWPASVTGLTGVVALSSGFQHTCAVTSGGGLTCWGDNTYGQLGNGTASGTKVESLVTVDRTGVSSVTAVALTRHATCAIVAASKVKCWGGDSANELGYDAVQTSPRSYSLPWSGSPTVTAVHTPVTPQLGGTDITAKAIEAGTRAVCVISLTDALACWGSITGNGTPSGGTNFGAAYSSNWVSGLTSATNVAVGTSSVCATNAGTVKCWGSGPYGELGDNNGTSGSSPSAAVNVLGLITQSVTFNPLPARTTADDPFTLTGSSSSGQALTYASSTPSVCGATQASSTWTLTIVGPGTCSVTATAAGGMVSGTYYASATTNQSFAVIAVAPVVNLSDAASVTTTTATLSATLNPALLGTTGSFRYSTREDLSSASTTSSAMTAAGAGTVSVTASLTGLSPGVKYYFTYQATNSVGTTTAPVRSFTMVGFAPVASSGSATSISSSRATLNASVTPGGLDTAVWFTWGQKSDLSDGAKAEYRSISDISSVDVSVTVTGLTESTRYYYRVEASNNLGTAKGDIKSFTASRPVGITINNAAEFTNSRKVTITATGPSGSTQVIISNDGGFGASQTFDLVDATADIEWTLIASRDERLPKTVYARFVQRFGTQSSTNTDDIILDTTAPTMTGSTATATAPNSGAVTVAGVLAAAARGGVKMTVRASDKNSGIGKVQVKSSASGSITDIETSSPKSTSRTVRVNTTKKKLWVRVVDRAGNVSKWVTVTVK